MDQGINFPLILSCLFLFLVQWIHRFSPQLKVSQISPLFKVFNHGSLVWFSYDSHPHIPDSILRVIPHSRYSYNIAKILYILNKNIVHEAEVNLDAYLEEDLYDNLTYCALIRNDN